MLLGIVGDWVGVGVWLLSWLCGLPICMVEVDDTAVPAVTVPDSAADWPTDPSLERLGQFGARRR